jgi:hypothetical protein
VLPEQFQEELVDLPILDPVAVTEVGGDLHPGKGRSAVVRYRGTGTAGKDDQ